MAERYHRFEAAHDRRAAMFEEMTKNVVIVWDTSGYDILLRAEATQREERGWRDMIASGLTPGEIARRGGKF
ncbi:hypothetical protein FACS1894187_12670 [Synergistales bacterium]|nr:hypothetical protein FACS1894187_12670 [Synergistales bacterium]